MSPQDSLGKRPNPPNNIYTVALLLANIFLALAIALSAIELYNFYLAKPSAKAARTRPARRRTAPSKAPKAKSAKGKASPKAKAKKPAAKKGK